MHVIKVLPGGHINLGMSGEHKARQVQFDISTWQKTWGSGIAQLIYQRYGDEVPYPVAVEQEGSTVFWTVTDTDTANPGSGRAELRYYVGEVLVKSKTSMVTVDSALGEPGEVPETPGQSWLDQAVAAGVIARAAAAQAKEAIEKAPYIGVNGNWFVYSAEAGIYEDTGYFAGGEFPYIGPNGNWFIGTEDSGVSATGPQGSKGDKGDTGEQGPKGEKGDTGEQGPKGDTGETGAAGPAGADGKTPEKGVDYWTADDKTAIVNEVLAALPTATGVSF